MRTRMSDETRTIAARVGAVTRHHPDQDHTELRRALNAARAEDWARAVAASAPPLSEEQRLAVAKIILGAQDG